MFDATKVRKTPEIRFKRLHNFHHKTMQTFAFFSPRGYGKLTATLSLTLTSYP